MRWPFQRRPASPARPEEPERTLFLHTGWPKTGTTTLQKALRSNRRLLREEFHLHYAKTGLRDLAHHSLAHPAFATEEEQRDLWLALADELEAKGKWTWALVSSEVLTIAPREKVEHIHRAIGEKGWRVRVIVYFRQPDEYLESTFAERIKTGQRSGSWQDFLRFIEGDPRLDYIGFARKWRRAFGDDAVIVRPYERASWKDGDIVADFFDTIGLPGVPASPDFVTGEAQNVTPGVMSLSFAREVARSVADVEFPLGFFNAHVTALCEATVRELGLPSVRGRFFDPEERDAVREKYRPAFEEIGIKFREGERIPPESTLGDLPEFASHPRDQRAAIVRGVLSKQPSGELEVGGEGDLRIRERILHELHRMADVLEG